MKVIELFSGSGNISAAFRARGHETLTIDNNPKFNPDMVADVMQLRISGLPEEFQQPDVIWASPPCTCFSVCTIGKHWANRKPKTKEAWEAIELLAHTLALIKQLKPIFWFIENPRGMMRKVPFMARLPRRTVCYCQYGFKAQKPTDIWTNAPFYPKSCSVGDSCHEAAPRGSKKGVQKIEGTFARASIPEGLCREIVAVCEGKNPTLGQFMIVEKQERGRLW